MNWRDEPRDLEPEDDEGVADGDDALDDREAPLDSDLTDDEDDNTVPCPHCRKRVHEDAEWCPHCGSFLSAEDAPISRSWLIWTGLILALLGMLWWLF